MYIVTGTSCIFCGFRKHQKSFWGPWGIQAKSRPGHFGIHPPPQELFASCGRVLAVIGCLKRSEYIRVCLPCRVSPSPGYSGGRGDVSGGSIGCGGGGGGGCRGRGRAGGPGGRGRAGPRSSHRCHHPGARPSPRPHRPAAPSPRGLTPCRGAVTR